MAISQIKGVFHCELCSYDGILEDIMKTPSSERFFTRGMKMLNKPVGFKFFTILGVEISSTSGLL